MNVKKVVIGADHGGFEVKNVVKRHLEGQGYEVHDLGVFSVASVDYPDVSEKVCREFLRGEYELGVLICGTGIGVSIAANKIPGIRCAVVHDLYTAEMAKAHNLANILAFGGRVKYQVPVVQMIEKYFETAFEGGRHANRVEKIAALESR